jgi:hypothetical protein
LDNLVRIKTYRIGQKGKRGFSLSIPKAWMEDHGINAGDAVDLFQDTEGDLILRPRKIEGAA